MSKQAHEVGALVLYIRTKKRIPLDRIATGRFFQDRLAGLTETVSLSIKKKLICDSQAIKMAPLKVRHTFNYEAWAINNGQ